MQKKRLLQISLVVLCVFLALSFSIVFALETHETFLCRKSTTVKAGEIAVVSFYVPQGLGELGLRYKFDVSKGTIKYMQFDPLIFQGNISSVIEFMEKFDIDYAVFFGEPENGIGGFSFPTMIDESGESYDNRDDYLNKTWDIFLYNEDSFDKEVTIDITRLWKLL
jgi:hypothetical protein